MQWPGFCGPSYVSQSSVILGERCINLYPQPIEAMGGKTRMALYPTPGFGGDNWNLLISGDTKCRGLFAQDGRMFAATDWHLVECFTGGGNTSNGGVINRGSMASNARNASMASNGVGGHQLAIASGGVLYILDLTTNVLAQAFDTGAAPILSDIVVFLDGYFISLCVATQKFQISALFDGTTWDPIDVAQSTAASDKWVSMAKRGRELWLLGSQTAQPWYNNGDADFPFTPYEGVLIEEGCAAIDSVVSFGAEDSGLIWLATGKNGGYSFIHMNGYTPERVSTEGVEWLMSQYTDVSDVTAYAYGDQGQRFYVPIFPTAQAGWGWSRTGGWHERLDWFAADPNGSTGWNAPSVTSHCFAFGNHVGGTRLSPSAYSFSVTDQGVLDGDVIRRVRRTPILSRETARVKIPRITLDVEAGLGLTANIGAILKQYDPATLSLQLSRDGGKTWGATKTKSLGATGAYGQRVYWDQNGIGRAIVGEFVFTSNSPFRVSNAFLGQPG